MSTINYLSLGGSGGGVSSPVVGVEAHEVTGAEVEFVCDCLRVVLLLSITRGGRLCSPYLRALWGEEKGTKVRLHQSLRNI